jgi:hypothetical protein
MTVQNCLIKVKDFVKKQGLDKTIPEKRLQEMARQIEAAGGDALTPADLGAKLKNLVENEEKRWQAKQQAMNAMILLTREKAVQSVAENRELFKKAIADGRLGNPEKMAVEALRVWTEGGSLRPGKGTNLSVEKMSSAIEGQLRDIFNRGMEPIKDVLASGQLDREILQELDAMDRGLPEMQSGSEMALQAAKVIKATRDKIFSLKQAYNPWLEQASDYLIKQFHDREKVSGDGSPEAKQAWMDQAIRTYGEKSFPESTPEEKLQKFSDIYDRIRDGTYGTLTDESASDKYLTVKGVGGDIARRMARSRSLIAKDWQAQYEYQSKFGPDTLSVGMDRVLSSAAKDIAVMSKFSVNPEGMWEGVFRRVSDTLSGPEKAEFDKSYKYLREKFDVVMGAQKAPARGRQASFVQGAMTAAYLGKTGTAILRSTPDLALAANLVHQVSGDSVFAAGPELAAEYAKSLAGKDYLNDRLSDLGFFSNAAHKELMRMLGGADGQPGKMAAALEKIGTLNLLNRHHDAMRSAVGTVLCKWAGDMSDTAFKDLHFSSQQSLQRYGIGETEWNVIRSAKETIDGRTVITPEAIQRIGDDVAEYYMRKTGQFTGDQASKAVLDHGRFQLALKYGAMLNEIADLGSAHPDTRQRSFFFGDTDINSGKGQLLRLLAQFKSAALVSNDVFRRGYFSGSNLKGDWSGVAQHMILGGFLWAMGEYANQIVSGKTPEDPRNPAFAAKTLIGSGAAGIWGDLIVNEMQRQGVKGKMLGISNSLLGPTLGSAVEGLALGSEAVASLADQTGHTKFPGQQIGGFVSGFIPGQNLFYTKSAFNYYFTNQLKEFLGPGYLGSLERGVNQTPGLLDEKQKYFMGRPTAPHFLGE